MFLTRLGVAVLVALILAIAAVLYLRASDPARQSSRESTKSSPNTTSSPNNPTSRAANPRGTVHCRPSDRLQPAAWADPEGELLPRSKQVAVALALRWTTYEPADPARSHEPLYSPGWCSRGHIVAAQLGGLSPRTVRVATASVMVVMQQSLTSSTGEASSVTRTLDIWLNVGDRTWHFARLPSVGGRLDPLPPPQSSSALAVLSNPPLDLPDSARWDIRNGHIDESLLVLLEALAGRYRLRITTLASGHPVQVFGEERLSRHGSGPAVDIHSVDGVPVVAQRADRASAAFRLVQRVLAHHPNTKVSSPWRLDAPRSRWFTDLVHHDHIHLAVAR